MIGHEISRVVGACLEVSDAFEVNANPGRRALSLARPLRAVRRRGA